MMRQWKILKSELDFSIANAALKELEDCCHKSQEQLDEMELLSLLVQLYQKERREEDDLQRMPDPIAAIDFRLEQRGMKRKDLKTYIGSASKVSEVMNHKIPLSLQMIRALHEGLNIPAEVLLQEQGGKLSDSPYLPKDFPFAEMLRRKYLDFTGTLARAKELGEELLGQFFSVMPKYEVKTCFRKTSCPNTDNNAIKAWQCHVIRKAMEEQLPQFNPSELEKSGFYKEIAGLSQYQFGPQIAGEKLQNAGIHLIYAQHLPHTRVDGAAFRLPDGHPVIAMTLRYDRLDNYWFTLMHELHHVLKDLPNNPDAAFMDDTENPNGEDTEALERAADMAAENALIPSDVWSSNKIQALLNTGNSSLVKAVASEFGISPAVLAGRLRWKTQKYVFFQDLLGKCRSQLMPATEEEGE